MGKKFLGIIVLLLALIVGGFFIRNPKSSNILGVSSNNSSPIQLPFQQDSPKGDAEEGVVPVSFAIPSLGIDTAVESVGMDAQGRMGVPQNPANVAWYNLGYKPGDKGSAVIAGHLDDVNLQPAVFWNVMKLNTGDEIIVRDSAGKELKFKVVDKQLYPYNQFPLEQVFNSTDKPRLNLITCQGEFNQASQNYTQRGVVYAELE
jgi:sortase (surface protein transpeptidase)